MPRSIALALLAACGDPKPPVPPAPIVVPIDAAIRADAAIALVPDPQCKFRGALEQIALTTDIATQTGTLERISTGVNHYRNIRYKVVPESATSLALVFVGYGPGDYGPILNWHGPSPPRERMTAGKSIVARIVVAGDLGRIVEGEVDLHTNMQYQTRDHSYPCALIDGAFFAAHPTEFLPR